MNSLVFLAFSLCFCATNIGSSQVKVVANPGCEAECSRLSDRPDVVYIRSGDHNSSVHFLLLATGNVTPSLLALHSSSPTAQVSINWNSLASSASKVEQAIHLEQVTQSYGLAFLSFVDFNLTTKDGLRSSPSFDRSPGSFRPHYFDKGTWRLTKSPVGNSKRISAIYQASLASHAHNGSVQIKVLLRDDLKSLDLEVTLDNFTTEYAHGQFGLEVVLSSNMSVVPGDDYLLTEKAVAGSGHVRTVYLDRRSDSGPWPVNDRSQPAGFFRSACHASAVSCEATLDVWRHSLTKSQNRCLRRTLLRYFYGERMHQQYTGLDSMTLVRERWSRANKTLPPIGLRVQRITFHTSSSHEVWRGTFGFTTELPQGATLTKRTEPPTESTLHVTTTTRLDSPDHTSITNQSSTENGESQSDATLIYQSGAPALRWPLILLICLAAACFIAFCVVVVVMMRRRRKRMLKEKHGIFLPLDSSSQATVEIQLQHSSPQI